MTRDNPNFVALDWLIGEINETLAQARQALEAFAADASQAGLLRNCLDSIHQVHGSLYMAELSGAGLLAEEMEQLIHALSKGDLENSEETREFLMRALLELPLYLEKAAFQRRDNPVLLLPLLNDLRAVRRENLVTEGPLFTPDLSALKAPAEQLSPIVADAARLKDVIGKLRKMYHVAAAGLIREVNGSNSLEYLERVTDKMLALYQGSPRRHLWLILQSLLEGMAEHKLAVQPALRMLLRRIDIEFRLLEGQGARVLRAPLDERFVRNLLFYVFMCGPDMPRAAALYQVFSLGRAVPGAPRPDSGDALAMGPEALGSAVAALQEEMRRIQDALDPSVAAGELVPLSETAQSAKRVSDTLSVLGLEAQRTRAREVYELIRDASRLGLDSPEQQELLLNAASGLIELDASLTAVAAGDPVNAAQPLMGDAMETVLREARTGLEIAKEAIVEYIAGHYDVTFLAQVPQRLQEVCGGLEIVDLRRAASILVSCSEFVRERMIEAEQQPEWGLLDVLADAVTSIEYFLERTLEGSDDVAMLLSLAEESVYELGYPVPGYQPDAASAANALAEETGLTGDPVAAVETPDVDIEAVEHQPASAEEMVVSAAEAAQPEPAPALEGEEESLIDDEIVEIFLEEAGEVLETIGEWFPRWAEDFSNRDALTEFRRGFHTLKGSGRMVEAESIGELAWSVENMLNRVIDGTVEAHAAHTLLIERVRAKLPSMIDAFRTGTPDPDATATAELQALAGRIAKGEVEAALSLLEAGSAAGADQDSPQAAPAAPALQPEPALQEAEEDDDGDQLWDIFVSEAEGHLEIVAEYLQAMAAAAPIFEVPSDPMHRALHTLKGSAHMADVRPVAALVAPLELFVKELRTYQVAIDQDIYDLINDMVLYVRDALGQIKSGATEILIPREEQFLARVSELKERSVGHLIREREAATTIDVDPQLLAVIMADGMGVLLDVEQVLAAWRSEPAQVEVLVPVRDELRILQEAASRAALPPLESIAGLLLNCYEEILQGRLECEPALWSTLSQGHNELLDMVDAVAATQNLPEVSEAVCQALQVLLESAGEPQPEEEVELEFDPAFLEGFDQPEAQASEAESPETGTLQADAPEADAPEAEAPEPEAPAPAAPVFDEPVNEASDIEAPEAVAEVPLLDVEVPGFGIEAPVVEVSPPDEPQSDETQPEEPFDIEVAAEAVQSPGAPAESTDDLDDVDPDIVEVFMEEAPDLVDELDEHIQAWQGAPFDTGPADALKRVLHTFKGGARMAGLMGLGEVAHRFETEIESLAPGAEPGPALFRRANLAYDLMAAGVEAVRTWMNGEHSPVFTALLQPEWADALAATDETEEDAPELPVESDEPVIEHDVREADAPAAEVIEPATPEMPPAPPATPDLPVAPAASAALEPASNILPFGRKQAARGGQQSGGRGQPQEMVRVASELLEELVNLAGETSISRGRLEEQMSEFGFVLDEMDATLSRLNDQLRRLDTETEAQIMFRQEQLSEADANFDPLEMDRYSQIQQLSRSLLEATSDLQDIRSTLGGKARDTETLLLQQSRINTELQEGLMRSRMVPFSRLVPRLRRIVRQVSSELGKQVELDFSNVEGELDRSMLERMVAPLEHMLRNAIDHGIEKPELRSANGKSATGRISVALAREGSDVVLTINDDGAGIDLLKVRRKAVENGLMRPDAELSNNEILQFVLQAGFSTAEQVTQISGRGVGLDVVSAEIKQMGGTVAISSVAGEGCEFVIRLPFTVSVNRALMVRTGDDVFALPLNTIEGIVRLSPFELEHYYRSSDARFEYAGEHYAVNYFGSLLQSRAQPKLNTEQLQLPVLLVRGEDHAMALQVDSIMGSQEIVVKSLGPQFASVDGLSGATVTGDGTVVVILDTHALIRRDAALQAKPKLLIDDAEVVPVAEDRPINVMVVDDSVTVRKVTSRFLEREGFVVTTAKDGQDAVIQLQDYTPDLILLDIEMPRMDGFEVARHIRSSNTLRDIPIIMITSRTGKKHRDHALSLGVNHYLGKPYQEDVLLHAIRENLSEVEAI
ncbi:hybrid sensor histidine kinase/response regulator [Biformimicrobium ophioploci]|uniref:histidine kinase n=1 Tax=Biformimicrobium ophioploci TaxID=3036711 RepID=A0ABQ6LV14_9GAMM|nr:Hpt domain-containing protein [Microbulbifer sp. NKW57]GMG85906.1 hypothetical protein MNKW57_02270 [Microbulbifer sp. NKW57]